MVGGCYRWLMWLVDGWRGLCVVNAVIRWLNEWLEGLLVGWRNC